MSVDIRSLKKNPYLWAWQSWSVVKTICCSYREPRCISDTSVHLASLKLHKYSY